VDLYETCDTVPEDLRTINNQNTMFLYFLDEKVSLSMLFFKGTKLQYFM